MTSPLWLLVVTSAASFSSCFSEAGAGFLSPPSSSDLFFMSQSPRYFPVYFKFPVTSTTTTTTVSPFKVSSSSAAPEVDKRPPPPPPPPPHDHKHPPHDHDHPHPPPPPPPKKGRRPTAAAEDQDGERSFPGEATLVRFEDWSAPVQVSAGSRSGASETLERTTSSRKDRKQSSSAAAKDRDGERSWSGTATLVNVEDWSPPIQVSGSQPGGIITAQKSKTLDQSSSSPALRVTTKSLTGGERRVPAPVVVRSRSYSFAPMDGLGSSPDTTTTTSSTSRFQQGRRPSATAAKTMRARSVVPAPVVVRSRSYSFAPPEGLGSSETSTSLSRFQQQQRRRPPPATDVASNYVQMVA